ncbi:MAG: ATP-binding protein [Leptospira sp.]|nr:ATP-binding protein [Leptospira sp.]
MPQILCLSELNLKFLLLFILSVSLVSTFIFIFLRIYFLKKNNEKEKFLLKQIKELEENNLQQSNELKKTNEELDNSLLQIREIKSALIYSKKMAGIGKLFAGIAHELNNPISAIKASSDTISEISEKEISEMEKSKSIFQSLNQSEMKQLIHTISKSNEFSTVSSYTERKENKKRLKTFLNENSYECDDEELEKLMDVGLQNLDKNDLSILSHKNPHIKDYILSLRNLGQHLSIIRIAVDRAASMLHALKKFSRSTDKDREEIQFKLIENIETVLMIYQYQMKGKVSLKKTYLSDALLFGSPEELYQVWTNILLNALQAMNFKGNIIINIQRKEAHSIEIRLIDNGPGIPNEIQKRIFDPEFTTKSLGEGSGMGLDLTKSIIQKHKGEIKVESEAGKTEFIICLPVLKFLDHLT